MVAPGLPGCQQVCHGKGSRSTYSTRTTGSSLGISPLARVDTRVSAKVQGWVWDLDLAAQPKLILLWLANRATDAGVCFPSKRELGQRTGLSERMVRYHLASLASERDERGQRREPVLQIVERRVACDRNTSNVYVLRVPWASQEVVRTELQELKHMPAAALKGVGTTGCTQGGDDALHPVGEAGRTQVGDTGCTENRSPGTGHPEQSPLPPKGRQRQQGEFRSVETETCDGDDPQRTSIDQGAGSLTEAFYGALGADRQAVTSAMRRRDLVIARQLLDAGATAAEAAAYARDVTASAGRIAPVDLRSFERERLGWLARRRTTDLSERRVVDRTGQPPSWQAQRVEPRVSSEGDVPSPQAERVTTAGATDRTDVAGNQLAEKLRTLFSGASQ
jgi:Helix-turn-helix domain